jgi:hypothetical protein
MRKTRDRTVIRSGVLAREVIAATACLTLASCGPTIPSGDATQGSSDSTTLCPSLGLSEKDVLLVTGDDHRVLLVHADASLTELDVRGSAPAELPVWVDFRVSSGAVVTTSRWSTEAGQHVTVRAFTLHDGELLWIAAWEIQEYGNPSIHVSSDGTVALGFYRDLVTLQDGERTEHGNFKPLGPPEESRLPVARFVGDTAGRTGWIDLADNSFIETPIFGTVSFHDGAIVGVDCVHGESTVRVQVSSSETSLSELPLELATTEFPAYCPAPRGFSGGKMLLSDAWSFQTIGRVDLAEMQGTLRPLDSPPGLTPLPCGWAGIEDTMDVLVPLSDGEKIVLLRSSPEGKWEPTDTIPLSGARGAHAHAFAGSFAYVDVSRGPCGADAEHPRVPGTLHGHSLQLVRSKSGVNLAWEGLGQRVYAAFASGGVCAAWAPSDERLVVVDLERGEERTVSVPAELYMFPGGTPPSRAHATGI